MWHNNRAKQLLAEWYSLGDKLAKKDKKLTSVRGSRILYCKTAGLIWHDRFELLLDNK